MRWPPPDDWPNRALSRRVAAAGVDWHVQEMGEGPTLLLIHGTGGATHSWAPIAPLLAKAAHIVMMDLPGQGFSQAQGRMRYGLDDMAKALGGLCAQEGWHPVALVGHSAGVPIALRLAEMGLLSPRGRVFGINAALGKFPGLAGILFPMAAKMLALSPIAASLFANAAKNPKTVTQILDGTGSNVPEEMQACYRDLVQSPMHVHGALRMMAAWQLDGLLARLGRNLVPTTFLVGSRDQTVPPETSERAALRLPDAEVIRLEELGHLAHEEAPEVVAELILSRLNQTPIQQLGSTS